MTESCITTIVQYSIVINIDIAVIVEKDINKSDSDISLSYLDAH